jgi:shikimate dehydrogenase
MEIDGKTQVAGVLGFPVSHSKSPAMHNAGYHHLNLPYTYIPFEVQPQNLGAFMAGFRALENFRGLNVTVPYKEAVIPYLDELDTFARACGAVNTIVKSNNRLVGYNTDGRGFMTGLYCEVGLRLSKQSSVVIVGAGGSSRALSTVVKSLCNSAPTILNRHVDKALEMVKSTEYPLGNVQVFGLDPVAFGQSNFEALNQADLIIQTTPVGMSPNEHECPIGNFDWVRPEQIVCDIIYKPDETLFLRKAKARGAQTLNGAGMLAGQGVLAFELITGHTIDYSIMRGVL